MHSAREALSALWWFFFDQSLAIGAPGPAHAVAPVLVTATALLAVALFRMAPERRSRVIGLIIVMPAIWILIGLWGGLFWYRGAFNGTGDPGWKAWPPIGAVIVFLSLAALQIWRVPSVRLFAVGYSLLNAYFVFMMYLLSEMAISGEWG